MSDHSFFWRTASCFVLILALFLAGTVRILVIGDSPRLDEMAKQSQMSVTVSHLRGNLYDCNGFPLTGSTSETVSVAAPTKETIRYLGSVLTGEEKTTVLTTLNQGLPATLTGHTPFYCAGIYNLTIPVHTKKEALCQHLIGYTDSSGHGVSGLEKALDQVLYSKQYAGVTFGRDGTGRVIGALEGTVEAHREVTESGVKTTIDRNIQTICESAMEQIPAGAALVSEVGTGKIRAMVSCPSYDPENVAAVLDAEDSPLLNRCLMAYNVGSSFKPCVAAAAMENGVASGFVTECTGRVIIGGNSFYCHNRSGHGALGLKDALAQSCNAYFYRFGLTVGARRVYEMATVFGFGRSKTLVTGLSTSGESLPSLSQLEQNETVLANLSIGQGTLLASPVSMLSLYEAIANGGVYHQPSVVEGIIRQGVVTESRPIGEATRAMSEETANRLKDDLTYAVQVGTGVKAQPKTVSAAGKTATAQTGWQSEDGQAVEHSWFCGFFPAEQPRYVVCVLVENSTAVGVGGAPLFSRIADGIQGLEAVS